MSFVPNTLANQSLRFCPSYQHFAGFDDAKEGLSDGVCVVSEEKAIESLQ